jgi:hypothetical protein
MSVDLEHRLRTHFDAVTRDVPADGPGLDVVVPLDDRPSRRRWAATVAAAAAAVTGLLLWSADSEQTVRVAPGATTLEEPSPVSLPPMWTPPALTPAEAAQMNAAMDAARSSEGVVIGEYPDVLDRNGSPWRVTVRSSEGAWCIDSPEAFVCDDDAPTVPTAPVVYAEGGDDSAEFAVVHGPPGLSSVRFTAQSGATRSVPAVLVDGIAQAALVAPPLDRLQSITAVVDGVDVPVSVPWMSSLHVSQAMTAAQGVEVATVGGDKVVAKEIDSISGEALVCVSDNNGGVICEPTAGPPPSPRSTAAWMSDQHSMLHVTGSAAMVSVEITFVDGTVETVDAHVFGSIAIAVVVFPNDDPPALATAIVDGARIAVAPPPQS